MTDDFGLFQFAKYHTPAQSFGYTLDDNARAAIVISQLIKQQAKFKGLKKLLTIYLNYLKHCQQPSGTFINYIGTLDKQPTTQNSQEDLSDAAARAMWALSEVMKNQFLNHKIRTQAQLMFIKGFAHFNHTLHLRAQALMIKALAAAITELPNLRSEFIESITQLAKSLSAALEKNSNNTWQWFESHLGYNNALLSEGLLVAAVVLNEKKFLQQGISSLQFLIKHTFSSNMYLPIGNSNWYKQNEPRSYYDQQPEDPAAMIATLATAYKITGLISYKNLASKCFSWFLGNNSLHHSLYDYETGGCYDGLQPNEVNLNQGAESLVSYLLAQLTMTELNNYENSTTT